MDNNFMWLQRWYIQECNGDWEHTYGVIIETLDNPGWSVKIDLTETIYASVSDREKKENYESTSDWMYCRIADGVFNGAGGPLMLDPIIETFRNWIEDPAR